MFGSVLHGNDREGSDLDILIDPTPNTTLMDVARIKVELEKLLGVSVDVLTPKALPNKFRDVVLAEARRSNNIQRVDPDFVAQNDAIPWQVMYARLESFRLNQHQNPDTPLSKL